jgi:hypothetical protein
MVVEEVPELLHGLERILSLDRLQGVGKIDGHLDRRWAVTRIKHLTCLLVFRNVTPIVAVTCHNILGGDDDAADDPV